MKFIRKIEQSIRNVVEGSILKGISGEIHPLEISRKIFEIIEKKAVKTKGKTIAPNYFKAHLSIHDHDLFQKAGKEILYQIYGYVEEQSRENKYICIDKFNIIIESDKKQKPGKCKIESDFAIRQQREGFASIEKYKVVFDILYLFSGFEEDKIYPLTKEESVMGRDSFCDIFVSDPNISRHHAKIYEKKCWLIEDMKSKNGTLVNGEKITLRALNNGDIIQIGNSQLQFVEL